MDNEKLEIVNMEPQATSGRFPWNNGESSAISPMRSQIFAVGGGLLTGAVIGYVLCKFVAEPIFAKAKAKKEAAKIKVVEPEENKSENKD